MRNLSQFPISLQEKLTEIDAAKARAVEDMGEAMGDPRPAIWESIRRDVIKVNTPMRIEPAPPVTLED